jgi:hypothetical protein
MKTLIATAALAVIALTGCAQTSPLSAAGTVSGSNGNLGVLPAEQLTTVTGQLSITGPDGYRVQTLTAYNTSDIDHVKLTLYKGSDTTATATKTVTRANLASAVTLANLKMATTYKIVAQAFADSAETTAIDNTAETGSAANNTMTFTTSSLVSATGGDNIDDATKTITIPVKLKNKTFAGNANSGAGVSVTNGTIVNTGNTETF